MTWRTTKHAEGRCPECGHTLSGSTSRDDAVPTVGDLTVCIECEAVLEYVSVEPLVLRKPEPNRLVALPTDVKVEIARLQWAIRQVHRAEAKRPR